MLREVGNSSLRYINTAETSTVVCHAFFGMTESSFQKYAGHYQHRSLTLTEWKQATSGSWVYHSPTRTALKIEGKMGKHPLFWLIITYPIDIAIWAVRLAVQSQHVTTKMMK